MAIFNNVLDSFAAFTGVQDQRTFTRPTFVDTSLGTVSPTIIGNHRSKASLQQNQLRKMEDERWLEVEGGSPLRWRSCAACAFLCAEHESTCEKCGRPAPSLSQDELSRNSNDAWQADENTASPMANKVPNQEDMRNMSLSLMAPISRTSLMAPILREVVIDASHLEDVAVMKTPSFAQENCQSPVHKDNASESTESGGDLTDDDEDAESEDEGELIPGALDFAPPPGTLLKVLYDDDVWYPAEVLTSRGTQARVRFENGKQETLDLSYQAARLADYVSEDDDGEETDTEEGEETTKVEADSLAGKAEDEDSESEEEAVPGTLDEAPPVGTLVKVLYDDERWYPAKITASNGTTASVVYEDATEEELDFDEHAVRLIDYVDEDEHEDEDEGDVADCEAEDAVKCGADQTIQMDDAHSAPKQGLGDNIDGPGVGGVPCATVIGKKTDLLGNDGNAGTDGAC